MRISLDLQIITSHRASPILKVNFGRRAYKRSARLKNDLSRTALTFSILNMSLALATTQASQGYGVRTAPQQYWSTKAEKYFRLNPSRWAPHLEARLAGQFPYRFPKKLKKVFHVWVLTRSQEWLGRNRWKEVPQITFCCWKMTGLQLHSAAQ